MNSLNWFQIIISLSLQATLLTALACAIERRCNAAQVKARIWSCYYLGLLGLLAAGLLAPRAYWFNPWQRLDNQDLMRVVSFEQSAASLLLAAWLAGLVYFAIRWIVQFVQLHRFLRSCRTATPDEKRLLRAAAAPNELLESAGRPVEFRICPEELGPFCYQLHQPAVYLPPSLMAGSPSELRHVLQHELTHLQTQHPLQVFTQRVVQTALWFVPAVWIAGRRAGLAREFVCDDAAVDHGASPASYLRTLLRYAAQPSHCGATLAIARSSSELRVRAQRLARPESIAPRRLASWAPSIVLLGALAASQAWLPTNPLASPKTNYSPWPAWSAAALHAFDVSVRDFDQFDSRLQIHELSQ